MAMGAPAVVSSPKALYVKILDKTFSFERQIPDDLGVIPSG
jgi:hypothetical protein